MRFRLGDEQINNEETKDADAIFGRNQKNIIIDHCSMSWCTDECASFMVTLISQCSGVSLPKVLPTAYIRKGLTVTVAFGVVLRHFPPQPISSPRQSYSRLCGSRYSNSPDNEKVDVRNNVFYNWGAGNGGYAGEGGNYNFVNNYYKPGAATNTKKIVINRIVAPGPDDGTNNQAKGVWGVFHLKGNYFDDTSAALDQSNKSLIAEVNNDNWVGFQPNQKISVNGVDETIPYPNNDENALKSQTEFVISNDVSTFTQSAQEAYADVLKYAGASYKRDAVDTRIIQETQEGDTHTQEAMEANSESSIHNRM